MSYFLVFLTLIHYYMNIPICSPCLSLNSLYSSGQHVSYCPWLIYLIISLPKYTCIVKLEFLTYTPVGRQLYWLEYSTCVQFILSLFIDSIHFQKYLLDQHHYSTSFSVRLFHTFIIQLDCFVTVCRPLRDPQPPKWFKSICIC